MFSDPPYWGAEKKTLAKAVELAVIQLPASKNQKETNMSKVDWSKAPDGAEFYASDCFYTYKNQEYMCFICGKWFTSTCQSKSVFMQQEDYEENPESSVDTNKNDWPEESRVDVIGPNGSTGEHYDKIEANLPDETGANYFDKAPAWLEINALQEPTTAAEFLSEGLRILQERGKQYDPNGNKELSFDAVAEAFCCLTGKQMRGSDVCLMLALLKIVRQNSAPGFNLDSAVDGINYMALWAEMIKQERT